MKNVLCALAEPNAHLLRHFFEYGKAHGWQLELCGGEIPPHWSGDGVLTDYLTLPELRRIDRFETTPVISRLLPPGGNIRTVRPDTTLIAAMIVDYFQGKGFTRFAMLAPPASPEEIDGKPRHIQTAVDRALAGRGLTLRLPEFPVTFGPRSDYRERVRKVREFLAATEPPYALILPSPWRLALTYRALAELGLRVPEEVAVLVNTDDWSVTENAIVPTSYIGGEFHELGSKMVELLDRMMSGEPVPETMVYSASAGVVTRSSTDTLAVSDLRLARAVSFLFQNYMNCISIRDAAGVAGVSAGMLIRLFRRQFGTSPLRFLYDIRLNRIRHLLDSSDLTLAEIARQTGYGSDMALSLAFRRETGLSPGAYRNSRRHIRTAIDHSTPDGRRPPRTPEGAN